MIRSMTDQTVAGEWMGEQKAPARRYATTRAELAAAAANLRQSGGTVVCSIAAQLIENALALSQAE